MKNIFLSSAAAGFAPGLNRTERGDRPYLFILFSVTIHILVLLALTTFDSSPLKLFVIPVEPPLEIEIVELPKYFRGKLKVPEKITALAQRSQEVEKEEYPKRSDDVTLPPNAPAALAAPSAVIALIRPGGGEQTKETATKTEPEKKREDKVSDEGKYKKDEIFLPSSLMPQILRPATKPGEKKGAGEGSVSLFPTRGSLQQIARQENKTATDSPRDGSGMTLLLNTAEFKYQKYFMNVKRRIQFYWEYPRLAARKGQQGRLNIDFVIHKDGTIEASDIDIIKSSNYPILDDAATTALRLASPFNPFPEGFDAEEITVHGQFEYSLIRRKR